MNSAPTTRTLPGGSVTCRTRRSALAGWWSTQACTTSAGAANKASSSSWSATGTSANRSRARSIATARGPARPAGTRSGTARWCASAAAHSRRSVRLTICGSSTTRSSRAATRRSTCSPATSSATSPRAGGKTTRAWRPRCPYIRKSGRLRGGLAHAFVHVGFELGEVVDEELQQLLRRAVVLVLVGPGGARVEDASMHAGHADRHVEAEVRILAELGIVERSLERRVKQRAGSLDRHTAPGAVFSAGPAGVEQPALHPAFGDPLLEQVAVDRRMARHERCAEAGAESCLGLGHA